MWAWFLLVLDQIKIININEVQGIIKYLIREENKFAEALVMLKSGISIPKDNIELTIMVNTQMDPHY